MEDAILEFAKTKLTLAELVRVRNNMMATLADKKAAAVGLKLLKLSASDFAYQAFPGADTMRLTALVANMVSFEQLKGFISENGFVKEDNLFAFLAHVCNTLGTHRAASCLTKYFEEAMERTHTTLDLPNLICFFSPGVTLQSKSRAERFELLQHELYKRGIDVRDPRIDDSDSVPPIYVVDVFRNNELSCSYTFSMPVQACVEEAIILEARKAMREALKFLKVRTISTTTDTKVKGIVPVEDLNEVDTQAHFMTMMHEIRCILRLRSPFREMLENMGKLSDINDSDGWIPLTLVTDLLVKKHNERNTAIEPPTEVLVQKLLDEHDQLQRFELGVCNNATMPFYKIACARALYAHDAAATVPLFKRIYSRWNEPQPNEVPQTAWVYMQKKDSQKFSKFGYRLFDNNAFVTAVHSDSINEFVSYVKMPPHLQFDEKVKDGALFMELNLESLLNDSNILVKQHPKRGDLPGHFILIPQKKYVMKSKAMNECKFFPISYFTGRTCVVKRPTSPNANDSDILLLGVTAIPPDPVLGQFVDRTTIHSNLQGIVPANMQLQDIPDDSIQKPVIPIIHFDNNGLRKKVQEFHEDPNRLKCLLTVPKKGENGASLFGRVQGVKALKEFILMLGLKYFEHNSLSDADELCIVKPQAFSEDVVSALEREIGVKFKRLDLLKEAITRECVNKEMNYERLEFIGDAVLDFIVMHDAAVVFPTFSLMCTVTSDVCRNAVLREVLPRSINQQLDMEYGHDLGEKTKADIFEAIVGAMYEDGMGLDMIRKVISQLFTQLHEALADSSIPEDVRKVLDVASRSCPYLVPNPAEPLSKYMFHCKRAISVDENLAARLSGTDKREGPQMNSHKASTGLPRIQDKDFATHFTTGSVYSYRRVMNNYRIHNRILAVFAEQDIAYVNELLTSRVALTFDFDGIALSFCNVGAIIAEWFYSRFRTKSKGLILDCSGMSVVSKKMKKSCHIHFPQVSLTIDELKRVTTDLRHYIIRAILRKHQWHSLRRGQVVKVLSSSLTYFSEQAESISPSHTRDPAIGRVILSWHQLETQFEQLRACPNETPVEVPELMFLSLIDVVQLLQVSKEWRKAAVTHLMWVFQNPLPIYQKMARSDTLVGFSLIRPLSPPAFTQLVPYFSFSQYLLVHISDLFLIGSAEHVEDFTQFYKAAFPKGKSKDFFENIVKPMLELDFYGPFLWDKVVDHGLVESKKLRMYLCDKWDTVYGQEFRPLKLHSLICPPTNVDAGPSIQCVVGKEGEVTTIPHQATLKMSSLRCPEFFDLNGDRYESWEALETSLDSQLNFPFSAPEKVKMPDYKDMVALVQATEWPMLTNALLTISPFRYSSAKDTGVVRHGALYPTMWRFSSCYTTFYVGDEPMFSMNANDLYSSLQPAMTTLMRHLVPHVAVPWEWKPMGSGLGTPVYLPMFSELKGSRSKPVSQQPSSPNQALTAALNSHSIGKENPLASMCQYASKIKNMRRGFSYLFTEPPSVETEAEARNLAREMISVVHDKLLGGIKPTEWVVTNPLMFQSLQAPHRNVFHPSQLPRSIVYEVIVIADPVSTFLSGYMERVLASGTSGAKIFFLSRCDWESVKKATTKIV